MAYEGPSNSKNNWPVKNQETGKQNEQRSPNQSRPSSVTLSLFIHETVIYFQGAKEQPT
jgi:hypothetical protein